MKTTVALVLSLGIAGPATVDCQAPRRHDAMLHDSGQRPHATWDVVSWHRATVHYAKWATGGAAAWLTVLAVREHDRSERYRNRLLDLCRADSGQCAIGSDGRYTNPLSEDLYQRSVRHDRRARTRLIGGQAALLVTVGLFLLDRKRGQEGPENIPLAPLEVAASPATGGGRVGLRLTFRLP